MLALLQGKLQTFFYYFALITYCFGSLGVLPKHEDVGVEVTAGGEPHKVVVDAFAKDSVRDISAFLHAIHDTECVAWCQGYRYCGGTGKVFQGDIVSKSFAEFMEPPPSKAEQWLLEHEQECATIHNILKEYQPPFTTLFRYAQSELDFPFGKTALHTALKKQGVVK